MATHNLLFKNLEELKIKGVGKQKFYGWKR